MSKFVILVMINRFEIWFMKKDPTKHHFVKLISNSRILELGHFIKSAFQMLELEITLFWSLPKIPDHR